MVEELEVRSKAINGEDNGYDIQLPNNVCERKIAGGANTISQLAAYELKLIRMSGDEIMNEICRFNKPPIKEIIEAGVSTKYVPYEIFKKVLIMSSTLRRKKDQSQIKLEVIKVKGMQKNAIRFLW